MCYHSGMSDVSKTIKAVLGENANNEENAELVRKLLVDAVAGNKATYELKVGNVTVPYKPHLPN